jgi:HEAT repeat protein
MAKASIEEHLATLQELRASAASADKEEIAASLRAFLKQPNNLIVARAADLTRELDLGALLPELIAAFQNFLDKPAKADPQCWAKNALSKTLHHLGHDEAQLFLQGMRLHQFEPTWGGQSDVAGTLRANCAHALIDCHELTHQALLLHLLELIADEDKSVRAEVLRAITQAGGDSAILLLRMRALLPKDEDPSVIGQCYAGLLSLEGTAAIPFVAQFLRKQDEFSGEAAVALGETRTPEAFAALIACLQSPRSSDKPFRPDAYLEPEFASVLLSSIVLTRQPQAIETLLELVATESSYAEPALEALANGGFNADILERLKATVDKLDSPRIHRYYNKHFAR